MPPKFTLSAALAQTANLVLVVTETFKRFYGLLDNQRWFYTQPCVCRLPINQRYGFRHFDDAFLAAGNYQSIINATNTDATQVNYKAVALIMKSFIFQRVVDLYNNVPYSQAFNSSNLAPKYDDAASIYPDLIAKLDTAIGYLKMQGLMPCHLIRNMTCCLQVI